MLKKPETCRFRRHRCNTECSKLLVDDVLTTDTEVLLAEWVRHFESLAKSKSNEIPDLGTLQKKMDLLEELSKDNKEYLLDTPFTSEEIAAAI